jgi:Site-specific recombinase XerD
MGIYRHGKDKVYYIRFKENYKDHRVRLLNPDGSPVTTESEAKAAASRILALYRERDKAEAMRRVKHDIEDADTAAKEAQTELANDKALVADIWPLYLTCDGRLNSCRHCTTERPDVRTTAYLYWHICDVFGKFMESQKIRRLSDVTQADAEAYLSHCQSSNTHGKHLTFLKHLYDVLIQEEKIVGKNPFSRIHQLPKDPHSRKPFPKDQAMAIIHAAEGDMKGLFVIGYYTGLRLGDCCTLRWEDIHLDRGVIERIPNKTRTRSDAVVKVGISAPLRQIFDAVPEDRRKGYLLPRLADLYTSGQDTKIDKEIIRIFTACGVQQHEEGTGYKRKWDKENQCQVSAKRPRAITNYSFYSLRYSYITRHAEKGTPPAVIQKNAGHNNPAMTEHYINISDEAAIEFANSFADADGAELRARLRSLALSLPISDVRRVLDFIDGNQ